MSRKRDSIEKSLSDLPPLEQYIAAALGRRGFEAWKSGIYKIAQWYWAFVDSQDKDPTLSLREHKNRIRPAHGDHELDFERILHEAARKRDGSQLRLFADALEKTGVQIPADPVTSFMLSQRANGARLLTNPEAKKYLKTVHGVDVSTKTLSRMRSKFGLPGVGRGAPLGSKQKSVHR